VQAWLSGVATSVIDALVDTNQRLAAMEQSCNALDTVEQRRASLADDANSAVMDAPGRYKPSAKWRTPTRLPPFTTLSERLSGTPTSGLSRPFHRHFHPPSIASALAVGERRLRALCNIRTEWKQLPIT
jgi:hypothetical protein